MKSVWKLIVTAGGLLALHIISLKKQNRNLAMPKEVTVFRYYLVLEIEYVIYKA
jgi:hypothetical protein